MKPEQSPKARRIAGRKLKILDAAAAVFADKGYQRATTREIARVADVAEGTIYNYFGNKQGLLLGILQQIVEETGNSIAAIEADDVTSMVEQALEARLALSKKHRMLLTFLHEARLNPEVLTFYTTHLRDHLLTVMTERIAILHQLGIMRPADARLVARIFLALVIGFGVQFELGDDAFLAEETPAALARGITDVLLHGLQKPDVGENT